MAHSSQIAGLIGPSLIAITTSETLNFHIWAGNIPPVIHLNGALLFVAGLVIVRAHNLWIRGWPVMVTVVGWTAILAACSGCSPRSFIYSRAFQIPPPLSRRQWLFLPSASF